MGKWVLTADWHIGLSSDSWVVKTDEGLIPSKVAETFKQLDFIFDYATKINASGVHVMGDIYHTNLPIPRYQKMLLKRLFEWDRLPFKKVFFKGNHDENALNADALAPLEEIKFQSTVFAKGIVNFAMDGINWIIVPHINQSKFDGDPNEVIAKGIKMVMHPSLPNVLLGHLHATGAAVGSEQTILRGGINFIDGQGFNGIKRMFFGHIHKRQSLTMGGIPVDYPGSPVYMDFGEVKDKKGFLVYDSDEDQVEFVELDTMKYKIVNVDLVNKSHAVLDADRIEKSFAGSVVKVKVEVAEENRYKTNLNEIFKTFQEHCYVARREVKYIGEKIQVNKVSGELNPQSALEGCVEELDIGDELKQRIMLHAKGVIEKVQSQNVSTAIGSIGKISLKKLILDNFRCFSYVNLDLSKYSVTGIVGKFLGDEERSNGSGKTTLLTSILYVLFGQYKDLQADQLVMRGEEIMSVTLCLDIDGKEVRIERENRKGKSSLKLIIDGQNVSGKIRETQDTINRLIGMDYKLFINTVFFLERESDEFCRNTPAARKEILRELLDLSIWDDCLKETKLEMKEHEDLKLQAEGSITMLKDAYSHVDIEDWRRRISFYTDEADSLERGIKKAKEELREQDRVMALHTRVQEDFYNSQISVEKLEKDLLARLASIKEREDRLLEINQIETVDLKIVEKELGELREKYDFLKQGKGVADHECTKARKEIDRIKEIGDKCPVCGQDYDSEKHLNELEFQFNEHKKNSESLQPEIETVRKKGEDFKQKVDYQRDIEKEIQSITEILKMHREEEKRIKASLEEAKQKYDKANIEFSQLGKFDLDAFTYLKEKLSEFERDFIAKKETILSLKKDIEFYEKNQFQIKELQDKISMYSNLLEVCSHLTFLFGKNGVSSKITNFYIDEIERSANLILGEIDNGEMSICFESERQTKKGELRDSLDIWVEDRAGGKRRYETFSNGEGTIVNFSIRLALAWMLNQRSNVWHGVIVLDEVFGPLDRHNRGQIIAVINFLRQYFDQMFVISHTDINECFDRNIYVIKDSGKDVSTVTEE